MSSVLLFVYGSLKRGFRHHTELRGAEWLGNARTAPGYRLVGYGAYPGLVPGGSQSVAGELYRIPASLLPALDAFEGCPDLYRRALVELSDGQQVIAYFVAGPADDLAEVVGGSWRERD